MQEFFYNRHREHYAEHHPILSETGEAQLINSYIPDECPHCANVIIKMNGHAKNGVQRNAGGSVQGKEIVITNLPVDRFKW